MLNPFIIIREEEAELLRQQFTITQYMVSSKKIRKITPFVLYILKKN